MMRFGFATRRLAPVALLFGVAALIAVGQPAGPPNDGLPYKIVPLGGDRVNEVLAQVESGTLVRLAAGDFDRLVRRANRPDRPTLISAHYRAKLVPDAGELNLIGTAEWIVRPAGTEPTIMSLDQFQLALRQAKWSDGQDAVLFKRPDSPVRLVVPAGADRSLNLEWSARGVPEPGEARFDLRFATAAVATLELELPTGFVPIVPAGDALLTGPFPIAAGTSWRIALGGTERLELGLRRVGEPATALFAAVTSRNVLTENESTARFEFQIEAPKSGFADLTFDFDPGFTPTGVRVNNLASWTLGGTANQPQILVRLSEPTRTANVVVTGSLVVPERWTCPACRLIGAVPRGEHLAIAIAPTLRFADWNPGGYRLTKAELGPEQAYLLEAEPEPLPPGQLKPVRPSLSVTPKSGIVWRAIQQADWRIGPDGETFSVRTGVEVTAGVANAASFRLPAGWDLDRVEVGGRESNPRIDGDRLTVELGRPFKAGETADVVAIFRHKSRAPGGPIPMPDLYPFTSVRDGRLTIRADGPFEARLTDATPTGTPGPAVATRLAPGEFERRLSGEPLVGSLYLTARSDRPDLTLDVEVVPTATGATIRTTLAIKPGASPVDGLTFWVPNSIAGSWVWRNSSGQRVADAVHQPILDARSRLLGLGGGPGSSFAALAPLGEHWSVRFHRPIRERTVFTAECQAGPGHEFPVPWIVGHQFSGIVRGGTEIAERLGDGFEPDRSPGTHRYGTVPIDSPDGLAADTGPTFDGLRLRTAIGPSGRTNAAFRFRVRHWAERTIPVALPGGATAVRLTIAGRTVPIRDGLSLSIPVPNGADWTTIEIHYELPAPNDGLFARILAPIPSGPFDSAVVRRVWHVSPDWWVTRSGSARAVPGAGSPGFKLPTPDARAILGLPRSVDLGDAASVPATEPIVLSAFLAMKFPGQRFVVDCLTLSDDPIILVGTSLNQFLSSRDLVGVEGPDCVLITTRAELSRWSGDVSHAVEEASLYGRDRSGRFRMAGDVPSDLDEWKAPPGWSIWVSDEPSADALVLGRSAILERIVWGCAAIVFVILVQLNRRPRARMFLLLIAVGAGLACLEFFPTAGAELAGPLLFAALVGGLASRTSYRSDRLIPAKANAPRPSRIAVVAASLLAVQAIAADPQAIVYQLPSDGREPGAMLVPPKLLERLRLMAANEAIGVVATSADYSGSRDAGSARFSATYRLWSFDNKPSRFNLPLQSVKLRELRVDGAEAAGVEVGPDGISLMVAGKGAHTLDVQFAVPILGAGSDRDVRFSVPEVPVSRLSFQLAKPAIRLRSAPWRGAVRTTTSPQGESLEIDPGLSGNVHLRWQAEAGEPNPTARVREASIWTLNPGFAQVTSLFEYRATGPTSEFAIAVPPGLEVSRVSFRGDTALATGGRVKAWALGAADASGFRPLTIELQAPVEGRVVLQLELGQSKPLSNRPVLQVPRALRVADADSYAALSIQGFEASSPLETTGLTETPAEPFIRGLWTALGGPTVKILKAYRSSGAAPAQIIVPLRFAPTVVSTGTEVTWWVEPTRLVGRAESKWSAGLGFVEWQLTDGTRVTEVTGRNLHAWSQEGGRIQAWLDRPMADALLTWKATKPIAPDRPDAGVPAVTSSPPSPVATRVRPTAGVAIFAKPTGEAIPPISPGEIGWKGTASTRVSLVRPAEVPLRATTMFRRDGDRLVAATELDVSALGRERPHRLTLYIFGAEGADVKPSGAGFAVAEVASEIGGRRWDVAIGPDRTGNALSWTVTGPDRRWPVPRALVEFGPGRPASLTQTLRVESPSLHLSNRVGLEDTAPGEWMTHNADWSAVLTRGTGLGPGERVRLDEASVWAARRGANWLYFARYRVTSDERVPLRFTMPPNAQSIRLNGRMIGAGEAVALPESSGARTVEVQWSTTRPEFLAPRLELQDEPFAESPVSWTVLVPPGLRASAAMESERSTGSPIDCDAFVHGMSVRFKATAQTSFELTADPPDWRQPEFVATNAAWIGLALLAIFPGRFRPERVGLLGLIGALAFGSAGIAFWAVIAWAVVWRSLNARAIVRHWLNRK